MPLLKIIFCDNHLLVVSKPADLSTQPHSPHEPNATDIAKAWIKKKYDKPGNVYLEPAHRLDKPVSGLLLFARTSKALSRLQEAMRQRKIKKTYFAWVEKTLPKEEDTLEHYLFHDEHRSRIVCSSHPEAKIARLHYKLLNQRHGLSYIEIALETGRYHQIRAQFSHIGCPIVGDTKYGSRTSYCKKGIALHHGMLALEHPVTKESLELRSNNLSFGLLS